MKSVTVSPPHCASHFGRIAGVVTILLAAIWGRLGAQEIPTGLVVELPKFVVTDSRELPPPESWRYGEIPGFQILTNASEKNTRRLIRDFGLFKQALNMVFPVPDRSPMPVTLILCGRGAKFDAFVPKGKSSVEGVLASLFLSNREQSSIVIDLESSTLNLSAADTTDDAATGTDSTLFSVDHDKQLYREYVHYLLVAANRARPRGSRRAWRRSSWR